LLSERKLSGLFFVGLELSHAKLEMLGAEINKSGSVFIKRVLSTFGVEQESVHAVEYPFLETVHPITPVHVCPLSLNANGL